MSSVQVALVREKISSNMEYLKRNTMRLKMLVSELVSSDLLTFDQADIILEQPNHLTMHERLYMFLLENSASWEDDERGTMLKLRKALRSSGNKHLVDILEK